MYKLWLTLLLRSAFISIIIDDLGDSYTLGKRTLELPESVTLSILPQTPHAEMIAREAHKKGMPVMLHQPMESNADNHLLGPGALRQDMTREAFIQQLRENLAVLPYVEGINNHMGSKLTSLEEPMNWLMAELKDQSLFFIDSRTTTETKAIKAAGNAGVPALSREVFLDHDDDPEAIEAQWRRLIRLAQKHGHAIAIGHPRKNTLDVLNRMLPELEQQNVELIAITDWLIRDKVNSKNAPFGLGLNSDNPIQLHWQQTLETPCVFPAFPCE